MSERKASMGDKVYRGDVVKFIRNNISLGTFMKRTVKTANEACWDLCDKLNYVPAIEEKPEPHWIPVEQALPEEPFGCLVTVMDTNPVTMEEFENILPYFVGWDGEQWNDGDGQQCPFEVLAWWELPEPYKGVTE